MSTTEQLVDDLNAVTTYEIHPRVLRDVFFKGNPHLAYYRDHCLVPFLGGTFSKSIFRYAPHTVGAYGRGSGFDIAKRQTLGEMRFEPRFYFGNVTEYMEDVRVINRGDPKIIDLVDADFDGVMKSINTLVALDINQDGQNISLDDRTLSINGVLEALNDGVTQGITGKIFPTYGNATRNTVYGAVLNSIPRYFGTATDGGPVNYNAMEEMNADCCFDGEEPDLLRANLALFTYIKQKIQVMQRITQERDPIWGVTGFKFNGAMVLADRYFWSSRYGTSDPILGNWLTSTQTISGTPDALSGIPSSGSFYPKEAGILENTRATELRITDDDLYGFGFTGFKPGIDNTIVAGQVLAELNMEVRDARLSKQFFGVNS